MLAIYMLWIILSLRVGFFSHVFCLPESVQVTSSWLNYFCEWVRDARLGGG